MPDWAPRRDSGEEREETEALLLLLQWSLQWVPKVSRHSSDKGWCG